MAADRFADWEMVQRRGPARPQPATALHALIGGLSVGVRSSAPSGAATRSTLAAAAASVYAPGRGRAGRPHRDVQLHDGDLWLYAYAVEPGTRSAEAVQLLDTWRRPRNEDGLQQPASV